MSFEIDIYARFGEVVKNRRAALKLTQEDLAQKVQLSRASIANIESGRQKILLHQMYIFAKSLNLEPTDLLANVSVATNPASRPSGSSQKEQMWVDAILRQVKNA